MSYKMWCDLIKYGCDALSGWEGQAFWLLPENLFAVVFVSPLPMPPTFTELKNPNCTSFPGGSVGRESTCNAEDLGSIPGLQRFPGGGHGSLLQYSCLESPHGQRGLVGCRPRRCKELDATEHSRARWHNFNTVSSKSYCHHLINFPLILIAPYSLYVML